MAYFWNLPLEITLDILSRLPPKSVGQCRCVSTQWRALLTRPEFIMTHLGRSGILHHELLTFFDCDLGFGYASPSNAHQVFDKITMSTTTLFSTDHPVFECLRWVVASCNGLILAQGFGGKSFVLNPITRDIREVPPPPLGCFNYHHITWGFGYDSVNDDFKLVVISFYKVEFEYGFRPADNPEMFVNVYSLRSGYWKRVQSSPCNHVMSEGAAGAFVNGCIHWLGYNEKEGKLTIAAFDLAEEKFSLVSPPCLMDDGDRVNLSYWDFSLDVLGGCLCLLINTKTEKSVWVMKEYGVHESWTNFAINGPELCPIRIELISAFGQEVVLWKDYEKWVLYNVKEGTLKDLVFGGMATVRLNNARFVESLVSPHS